MPGLRRCGLVASYALLVLVPFQPRRMPAAIMKGAIPAGCAMSISILLAAMAFGVDRTHVEQAALSVLWTAAIGVIYVLIEANQAKK